jgi:aspartate aminotransferase-like enzyme
VECNLRIPGPTPLPPSVLNALGKPMIGHRGKEFRDLFGSLLADLKTIFQTESDIILLASSGTGAMEAAIVNTVAPGDTVLAVSVGYFGDRFAAIAETCGADVDRLDFSWGSPVDPQAIRARLEARPGTKAVLVTHNETSTGVTNDLEAVCRSVHSLGDAAPLVIVDAVSSVAAIDLRTDEWGCDIVTTCSQKALMAPPGIGLLSVSPKAWDTIERTKPRSYYFDLKDLRRRAKDSQTPATPPVSDMFGLRAGVDLILEEGLPNVFDRHRRLAARTRQGIAELGLGLLADDSVASNTVTAVRFPEQISADGVRACLKDEFGIAVGGGQGPLKDRVIRIGHMGYTSEQDIDAVLTALQRVISGSRPQMNADERR